MASRQTMQERQEYLEKTKEHCDSMWQELAPLYPKGTTLNTLETRMNHFILFLKKNGILTEEQHLEFEIEYVENIEDTLLGLVKEAHEEIQESRSRIKLKSSGKLFGLNGKPLN